MKRQPVANYIKAEWLDNLAADPRAYWLAAWSQGLPAGRQGRSRSWHSSQSQS